MVNKQLLMDKVNLLDIKHKGKDKLLYMKFCPDDCIHAISECCHNILNNTFKFNPKELSVIRKKMKPSAQVLRQLGDPKISIQKKRKLLQKPQVGNGILGIIASFVIPALMKAIVK